MPIKMHAVFENIPENQWETLKEKISKAGGKLIVLVHPFIHEGDEIKKYETVVRSILSQQRVPIVILNEYYDTARHEARKKLRELRSDALLVPTEFSSPLSIPSRKIKSQDVFKMFLEKLEKAGAKNIFIGGLYASDWLPNHEQYVAEQERIPDLKKIPFETHRGISACVGATYSQFIYSGKFERVQVIPEGVFPDPPFFYKRLRDFREKERTKQSKFVNKRKLK